MGTSAVGTALAEILHGYGIVPHRGCPCIDRAIEMNERGIEWCETNIDTIVGWLRDEAHRRRLPFIDAVGRLLIRRAIANARRAASTDSTPTPHTTGNPPPTPTG